MKSQPLHWNGKSFTPCLPHEATHLRFRMPGPIGELRLPVMIGGTREGTPNWTWNGSIVAPTLRPSVKSDMGEACPCCHSWITDGRAQFLDDTTHELKGQTVDLLDLEEDP